MRHVVCLATLSLLLLTTLPTQAQEDMIVITPEQIGQIYCIGSLGNDMSPVSPMLTPDLATVIDNGFARSNAFLLENPGDKPPLGNGIAWRTLQDYADGCTVGATGVDEYTARVTIEYSFTEAPEANYSNDLLLLKDEGGFWRIDDVDLGEGNTLRSVLAAAFEE